MNDRVRELFEQCTERVESTEFAGEQWTQFDEEKFAKLLVQECETALSPMLRDMISRGQAADIIKKHFLD